MKIRDDIAALLRAGVPQRRIARQLHCAPITVQRTREALHMPSPGRGSRPIPATFEEAFQTHLKAADDGHIVWQGGRTSDGTPLVFAQRGQQSAYRVAFTLYHGRDPVGRVIPGCGVQGCVSGGHLTDGPMRAANQRADRAFAVIFREAA